ncbi:hypothetical protein B0T10DRAFT_194281 [Thelonectria olida]|uniref:F-box domain-containing protein n=1 Tax=Thelonectria olida TaxID=1576542 RepID=A0A9P9AGU1_9HYPO|nr:hypothetical protein B0T10DRAFT_194281 [Thelonectria olida]
MPDSSVALGQEGLPCPSPSPKELLGLPRELIDMIVLNLSAFDLVTLSATCRKLRGYAISDKYWRPIVQENVPGVTLTEPGACESFRDLYVAHDRLWFLPKYKIWFTEHLDMHGKLIIVRFDPRRGAIDGYQLVSRNTGRSSQDWHMDGVTVSVPEFKPQVSLHLDQPILHFGIQRPEAEQLFTQRPDANRYADEIPMQLDDRMNSMYRNFRLATSMDEDVVQSCFLLGYPYRRVWPPPAIPSSHHICSALLDRPSTRSEVYDRAFQIHTWAQMSGPSTSRRIFPHLAPLIGNASPTMLVDNYRVSAVANDFGVRMGESIVSFATLDPYLYTPTPLKPWRGIWIGDYNGHGTELILIHQPDDEKVPTDMELGIERRGTETDAEWEARRTDVLIHQGRLEAIKLTGDPNVPRGEHTFIVDDLSNNGHVEHATDEPFYGVRMVRSQGHVAETNFYNEKYIETRLLLISHDRLAQYWIEFESVCFLERVDIDSFLSP